MSSRATLKWPYMDIAPPCTAWLSPPTAATLLSGGEDGTLRVWEVASRQCVRVMQGYAIGIYDLDWSPDGMHLVSGGTDTLVTIWDVTTGTASKVLRGHNWIVYGVAWSPDGRWLASCELHTLIRLWDATSGACVQTLQDLAASPFWMWPGVQMGNCSPGEPISMASRCGI